MIVIIHLQRGMPSKRESSARIDYVPALCTHRPSLLPIEWFSESHGPTAVVVSAAAVVGKWFKLDYLEEAKVVTRFP